MPSVNFFCEDIDFHLSNSHEDTTWIHRVIKEEKHSLQTLNFIFCSDRYLHRLNLEFLHHDTYTDIITFDQSEAKSEIDGEIYISIERVKENAIHHGQPFEKELHRVMIHGVLHLLGYGDKSAGEKKKMREKEDSCLSLRQF